MLVDSPPAPTLDETVAELRRFNRFHSDFVGALRGDFLGTQWTLQEARILYEVAAHGPITQTELLDRIDLDQGYLSRIVGRLRDAGLLDVADHPDGRRKPLVLSDDGQAAFDDLDRRSQAEMTERVDDLSPARRLRLIEAMATVRDLLHDERPDPEIHVRAARPGDLGWSFMRQAEMYTEEFHYKPNFEGHLADTFAPFLHRFHPERDRLWIAERGGRRIGSIAIQHDPDRPGWAKLRWYIVEPDGRGRGVGTKLLETAIAFARDAHYNGIYLWTMSDLSAAAKLYERMEFRLVDETSAPWHETEVQQRYELQF